MKVIVAHPGQQHSFKVASALKHEGNLFKYMTAVYDKPDNIAMRLAHLLVRVKDIDKITKRKNKDLEDEDVITYYTLPSLAVIVFSRFKATQPLSLWLDRRISSVFGRKVAKYAIKHKVDAVICFSMNEVSCFRYLRKHAPEIKRIVDYANAPIEYTRDIYTKDCEVNNIKKEAPLFWDRKELKKLREGIRDTQLFIAPSTFVKNGLKHYGVPEENIKVLFYGSNFTVKKTIQEEPIRIKFAYVGQVTFRKGIHHLLEAFSSINNENISLDIVGEIPPNSQLFERYKNKKNIRFHGQVSHHEVKKILENVNIFIFTSLADTFGLAVLEALSCGLPVICSSNAGVSDLIIDGKNGFVIKPDDIVAIKEKIQFFVDNKNLIPAYSRKALDSAKKYTWKLYEKKLSNCLNS